MEPIQIGQRVRVTNGQLVHYRQMGTVVLPGDKGWYVHLDYDAERPNARIFFYADELEDAGGTVPPQRQQEHWSVDAGLDHRAELPPHDDARESVEPGEHGAGVEHL